jgi:glycosyltransferase involved in cell wall biosynthesis
MDIVLLTRRYWPAIGGVERVAMSLGESLCANGHSVTVVAQCIDEGRFGRMTHIIRENQPFAPFAHNGVQVIQLRPSRRRRTLLLPFALELIPFAGRVSERWLRRYTARYYTAVVAGVLRGLLAKADLVHVLGGELMAAAAIETARSLGKPTAISPFAHPGAWGLDAGSISAYRKADVVMATTNADAEVYREVGVSRERLRVVGLPVAYIPAPPAALALPELPRDDAPLVVFLGARRPTKGVDVLLAATPLVWRRHPEARFAFVGPGAPLPAHDDRLLDVGAVSDEERSAWLARATLLCLPSAGESFGLVVPEAWSHGVPVVVSNIPVLQELVDRSRGGLATPREAAPLAEAICAMLGDSASARSMGQAGRAYWLEHLTPEAVMRQQLEIYEALLAGRRAAPPLQPSSSS